MVEPPKIQTAAQRRLRREREKADGAALAYAVGAFLVLLVILLLVVILIWDLWQARWIDLPLDFIFGGASVALFVFLVRKARMWQARARQ